jgi:hypothetical protein
MSISLQQKVGGGSARYTAVSEALKTQLNKTGKNKSFSFFILLALKYIRLLFQLHPTTQGFR